MFDRTTNHMGGPSHVTIHEHKAATDDSIRLYGEMQDKALQAVIAAVPTAFNELKGTVAIIQDFTGYNYICIIKYTLNGFERTFETRFSPQCATEELVTRLKRDFAEHLCGAMLSNFADEFIRAIPQNLMCGRCR